MSPDIPFDIEKGNAELEGEQWEAICILALAFCPDHATVLFAPIVCIILCYLHRYVMMRVGSAQAFSSKVRQPGLQWSHLWYRLACRVMCKTHITMQNTPSDQRKFAQDFQDPLTAGWQNHRSLGFLNLKVSAAINCCAPSQAMM